MVLGSARQPETLLIVFYVFQNSTNKGLPTLIQDVRMNVRRSMRSNERVYDRVRRGRTRLHSRPTTTQFSTDRAIARSSDRAIERSSDRVIERSNGRLAIRPI